MHITQHVEEEKPEDVENEAVEQLAFADRILLNKIDLVSQERLEEVEYYQIDKWFRSHLPNQKTISLRSS